MPPANNCCCFCLTAKTGVIFIGMLTWINFLGSTAAGVTLAIHAAGHPAEDYYQYWYFVPGFLLYGIIGCSYSNLGKYEGTYQDFKKRSSFWKSYFVCIVLLHSIYSVIFNVSWVEQLYYTIKKEEDRIYYGRCTFDYNHYHQHHEYDCGHFWIQWGLELLFNIYFCYVCMLYADLANPAARRNVRHGELGDDVHHPLFEESR